MQQSQEVPSILTAFVCVGERWLIFYSLGIAFTILLWLWKSEKLPFSAKCLLGYVLLWALYILEYPAEHFGLFTRAFQATAGQTFVEILFVPIAALIFRKGIGKILPLIALFSCLCVWFTWPGLLNAPSFNSGLAALCAPFVSWWVAWVIVITAITHHGSTALLILCAQISAHFIRVRKLKNFAVFLSILTLAYVIAQYHQDGGLFNGSGRLGKYIQYMTFWKKEWRWIFLGIGPGTFMWTSLMLDQFKAPLFLQLHSDFLQIIFELGLVGLGLCVWVFIHAIRKAWGNVQVLAGLFGCAAFTLTYMPCRYFPSALIIAWIFWRAINCKTNSIQVRQPLNFDRLKRWPKFWWRIQLRVDRLRQARLRLYLDALFVSLHYPKPQKQEQWD